MLSFFSCHILGAGGLSLLSVSRRKSGRSVRVRLLSAMAAVAVLVNLSPVKADDGPNWMDEPAAPVKGVVTSENAMVKRDSSAAELLIMADSAIKSGKIDRAIELIKRSLALNNEDLDAHVSYATALEKKLESQSPQDPNTFNLCVREWLAVLRNKYGEEKSETFHGVGIPGVNGRFFADDDRHGPARTHLVHLTGSAPKVWETNEKFLARVLRHGEAAVSGKMVTEGQGAYATAPAQKNPQPAP
jgi:hypothetical protein